jgi:hypothetical protein
MSTGSSRFSDEFLMQGEKRLGEYVVALIRRTPYGWSPTVPPLVALVTNLRLLLQPQTRRPHDPACIPANYIMRVREVEINNGLGVHVSLRTGHSLYILPSASHGSNLHDSLKHMMTTPVTQHFHMAPPSHDLQRLIDYISHL